MDRRELLRQTLITTGVLMTPRWLHGLEATAPSPYLDAALGAERWLSQVAQRSGGAVRWPVDPQRPETVNYGLYSGTPGIVLFYLELHHATGEARYLDEARAGARALSDALSTDDFRKNGAGLYTGLAGAAYVLQLLQEQAPDAGQAKALAFIAEGLRSGATSNGDGTVWNQSTDIISGTAGIALALAWLGARDRSASSPWRDTGALLRGATRSLLEAGVASGDGTKWAIAPSTPRRYPNFSHGTAGVSYTLATLAMHPAIAEEPALQRAAREGALSGARYLESITSRTPSGGRRIFHSEPGGEQLFYLSWCHGPAGTARLYRQLERLTGDASWRSYQPAMSRAIIDGGVPELHPDLSGFWNNISQCCGNCGVAEYFLDRHAVTRDASDLAFARRVMEDVIARATTDGSGLKWIQAENRVSPQEVLAQTGFMQGAAGVGVALLHLDGALQGRKPLVVLPDSPPWT